MLALTVPEAVEFPTTDWLPTNVLGVFSCGTLVVSRLRVCAPPVPPPVRSVPATRAVTTLEVSTLSVTVPLVPPPVSAVPAVTPPIVPPLLLSALHAHALPLHFRIWLAAHVVGKLRLIFPLVPPPMSPEPAVTPVMVPAPVPGNNCPDANVI